MSDWDNLYNSMFGTALQQQRAAADDADQPQHSHLVICRGALNFVGINLRSSAAALAVQ
jgi:hypothetical protein